MSMLYHCCKKLKGSGFTKSHTHHYSHWVWAAVNITILLKRCDILKSDSSHFTKGYHISFKWSYLPCVNYDGHTTCRDACNVIGLVCADLNHFITLNMFRFVWSDDHFSIIQSHLVLLRCGKDNHLSEFGLFSYVLCDILDILQWQHQCLVLLNYDVLYMPNGI